MTSLTPPLSLRKIKVNRILMYASCIWGRASRILLAMCHGALVVLLNAWTGTFFQWIPVEHHRS